MHYSRSSGGRVDDAEAERDATEETDANSTLAWSRISRSSREFSPLLRHWIHILLCLHSSWWTRSRQHDARYRTFQRTSKMQAAGCAGVPGNPPSPDQYLLHVVREEKHSFFKWMRPVLKKKTHNVVFFFESKEKHDFMKLYWYAVSFWNWLDR